MQWLDAKICLPYAEENVLISVRWADKMASGLYCLEDIFVGYLHYYKDGHFHWKLITKYKTEIIYDQHKKLNQNIVTHWMPLPEPPVSAESAI